MGPDKLDSNSDYAIWPPGVLIDKFTADRLPDDLQQESHVDRQKRLASLVSYHSRVDDFGEEFLIAR